MHGVALSNVILYLEITSWTARNLLGPHSAMKCSVLDLVEYNLFSLVNVEIVTLFFFIRFELNNHS